MDGSGDNPSRDTPTDRGRTRGLVLLTGFILVVFVGGILGSHWTNADRTFIGGSVGLIGLGTFLGSQLVGRRWLSTWSEHSLQRMAISFSFIIVWFALAVTLLFARKSDVLQEGSVTKIVFEGLTDIVKVVIGFYFASSAAVQVADRIRAGRDATTDPSQPPTEQ